MEQLTLDEIIKRMSEDRVVFEKAGNQNKDSTLYRTHKFILDTNIAEGLVKYLTEEFKKSSIYGVIEEEKSGITGNGLYVLFGYRKSPLKQQRGFVKKCIQLTKEAVMGFGYYHDLNHFATAHVFALPYNERIELLKEGETESSLTNKSILMINIQNILDSQHALHLMNTVYSGYKLLKTPSETLPTHSLPQNP